MLILLSFCLSLNIYCLLKIDREKIDTENIKEIVMSSVVISLTVIPVIWLLYLVALHSYLMVSKKSTIQLILESRNGNKIVPAVSAAS